MTPEIRQLLADIAEHFKRYDGFGMQAGVDYPGYPDDREAEARALYERIKKVRRAK